MKKLNLVLCGLIKKVIIYGYIIFLFLPNLSLFAQNHRYERYNEPESIGFGFKILLFGGAIWGFGMLIIMTLDKNEKGVVKNPNTIICKIAGIFCVIGGIIAVFGLIMLGF